MKKIDYLTRFLIPCYKPTTTHSHSTTTITVPRLPTTKKRLSTSLRNDIPEETKDHNQEHQEEEEEVYPRTSVTAESVKSYFSIAPPRISRTMVVGTLFGHRRGHVCFCIQHDRLNYKPSVFLEFIIPTCVLVKEMQCGLVRIALECTRSDLSSCPLNLIPIWDLFINGRKFGFATRRKTSSKDRMVLKSLQSMTVGAGVIPMASSEEEEYGELIYMRANYERVIGSSDSESFYLINPDSGSGQEFSVFLMRSC